MPRRSLLTQDELSVLLAFPTDENELIRRYTFSETDLSVIHQRRGKHNRLGFAVQLCYLRYPGFALPTNVEPPSPLLAIVGRQLQINTDNWSKYTQRSTTRREHLAELQVWLKLTTFAVNDYHRFVDKLGEIARQTDRGILLAEALIELLRQHRIIIPSIDVIERMCSEALTLGTRQLYKSLTETLSKSHILALDQLLTVPEGSKQTVLIWLRQSPGPPKPKHLLIHLTRLQAIHKLRLPQDLERRVHQNRLLKLAREGNQMTAQHLYDLESTRKYATLVAVMLEMQTTLIDEIIDMHDQFMGTLFSKARRKHADLFQESGKSINDKVRLYNQIGRALLDAKESGSDPFAAIEAIIPWDVFSESINEAEKLAQPEEFDYLSLARSGYNQLRRYTPLLLEILTMNAASTAQDLLAGVEVIKKMNANQVRKVPDDAPTSFVRKRWKSLVKTPDGLDRCFYELCVLSELKNSLRSGDIWVQGSRHFKDFEEYLLPTSRFKLQNEQKELGLAIETDCELFLESRLAKLEQKLATVEKLAADQELPDAIITDKGHLKITPLDNAVPHESEALLKQVYRLLPHLKITELLLEVDKWTGFTSRFKHLKSGEDVDNQHMLLTTILADAINLGLDKMAESCPDVTYEKLTWLQAWYIRDETYSAALAELVNAQLQQPFSAWWGNGTTSSSDGQNFKVDAQGKFAGQVNLKYGQDPGVQFYTHISDQYIPFHIKIINATVRDATYVLDGLLYHESDLRIEEHYTDTAGFTDHVFALMQLLGFRFAPRIRDLADKRLYIQGDSQQYPTLSSLIGGNINVQRIRTHWEEILRLTASIQQGTVTASLMLRKLGSYPRQNGLALALRELGRIERTLFALEWMQNVELRRRVQIGLNKGESKNALARALFLNRLGEIRDRSFEKQRYRASGLNLVVAAIVLWNTVYLERAIQSLRDSGKIVDDKLLIHLSPLGWEHINLNGNYVWQQNKEVEQGNFRPLRTPNNA